MTGLLKKQSENLVSNSYPVNKHISTYEVETPDFWNNIYNKGNLAWGSEPASILSNFMELFPPSAKVLDIGCGKGRNSIYLSKLGYDVTGIDISQSAIDLAISEKSSCKFYCMDALNDDLNQTFDVIIDFGLFHFIPPEYRKKYNSKIHDMLNPGGLYFNQSGRLVKDNPIVSDKYVPPQLEKSVMVNSFNNFDIKYLEEDVLPPMNDYRDYPCWNLIAQKQH